MKHYNTAIVFILILLTVSVSSYFYYLDIIYKDKLINVDIKSLNELKDVVKQPIIAYANEKELEAKAFEYNQIISELNINASAQTVNQHIIIKGNIDDSISYVLLKRLLNIIKNDSVNLVEACIGESCNDVEYGFVIKFQPYILKSK